MTGASRFATTRRLSDDAIAKPTAPSQFQPQLSATMASAGVAGTVRGWARYS
jgi:hypothetical protein